MNRKINANSKSVHQDWVISTIKGYVLILIDFSYNLILISSNLKLRIHSSCNLIRFYLYGRTIPYWCKLAFWGLSGCIYLCNFFYVALQFAYIDTGSYKILNHNCSWNLDSIWVEPLAKVFRHSGEHQSHIFQTIR